MWLLKEHKLCVQELQKLKTMIEDLHRSDLISIELFDVGALLVLRYIDLIHQRGQALFNAYNDMRKKLGDVRNEIAIIGRKNHDAEQTIKRLIIVFFLFCWDLVTIETMAVLQSVFFQMWEITKIFNTLLEREGAFWIYEIKGISGENLSPDIDCGQAESGAGGLEESEQQDAGGAQPGEGPGRGDGEEGGGVQG